VKTKQIALVIATPPDGVLEPRPGIRVGEGLAIAHIGRSREHGDAQYSITHEPTGYRIGEPFIDQSLAIRCAEEMVRRCSFEQPTFLSVMEKLAPLWNDVLLPVYERYHGYDVQKAEKATS